MERKYHYLPNGIVDSIESIVLLVAFELDSRFSSIPILPVDTLKNNIPSEKAQERKQQADSQAILILD
jgi:hypothetical protein